jgi:hypothetical protein
MLKSSNAARKLIAACAVVALMAVACGGGDDDAPDDDEPSSGVTAEATAAGPTARPATATPVPDTLAVTNLTCGRDGFYTSARGRVRNAGSEPLTDLRAQIVFIDQQQRATIPYLVGPGEPSGPYTGISYDIRFDAEAMAVVESPNDPNWIAESTVAVTPAALAPGAEGAFEFPSTFGTMAPGQCAVVFIQCAPACEEIKASDNKVSVE